MTTYRTGPRKVYTDRVYVVVWPLPIGVIKVGYTSTNRHAAFINRGATLRELVEFTGSTAAFDVERAALDHLAKFLPRAFSSATEAVDILGNKGAGYMECYTFREEDQWLIDAPISSWTSDT